MAEVTISVGGRAYTVACDDGQEERVASLAARIDAEAAAFAGGGAGLSEARLLLMSALMIADKLDEAETTGGAAPVADASPQASAAPDLFSDVAERDQEAVAEIDAAIERLEALTSSGADAETDAAPNDVAAPSAESDEDDDEPDPAEMDADATDEDSATPMTREQMRALRRQRRRAMAEKAQEENTP
ncbi:MAG: cell division protein ZapA [Pseudomonadota bacterium]